MDKHTFFSNAKVIQAVKSLRFMYLAFTFSGTMIWVVLRGQPEGEYQILLPIAAMTAILSFILPTLLMNAQKPPAASLEQGSGAVDAFCAKIMTVFMVRWALAEASLIAAIFALSGQSLSEKAPVLVGFLILQVLHFPSMAKLESIWAKTAK